jgi:Carbohydrate esterase, sialic acid-specific acetylesterase
LAKGLTNLVCGDAYIIEGQSNALAVDNNVSLGGIDPWIFTYGKYGGWDHAVNKGGEMEIGVWGFIFAKRLSTDCDIPICIINGAVGGTRIDRHRPNPLDHSLEINPDTNIYANLYNRVVGAKLTHGIRAVLWHQGEQDQVSGGIDGDYNYKFYNQYFVDISAAWKHDFPNILKYYVFQIWPAACGLDTPTNNLLREVQRNLPFQYSNMRLMSTVGFTPYDYCHFSQAGYQEFSDRISALVKQDFHSFEPSTVFTAPNLLKAYFTTAAHDEIALAFDQAMALWNIGIPSLIFLDDIADKVASGSVSGNVIKLRLSQPSTAQKITYLKGEISWNPANLIKGENLVAALTFADVPIALTGPPSLAATAGNTRVSLAWTASTGATSYNIRRSLISGGPYTDIGTTTGTSFTDTTANNGTLYFYVVSATNTAETLVSNQVNATACSYMSWASTQRFSAGVNDGPLDDPDRDGISNLLEFTLAGEPMVSTQKNLPRLLRENGSWVFKYDRSDSSLAAGISQIVEYGSNLTGWTQVLIPTTSSGMVEITPAKPSDHVKVTIPNLGSKKFARLKVSQ